MISHIAYRLSSVASCYSVNPAYIVYLYLWILHFPPKCQAIDAFAEGYFVETVYFPVDHKCKLLLFYQSQAQPNTCYYSFTYLYYLADTNVWGHDLYGPYSGNVIVVVGRAPHYEPWNSILHNPDFKPHFFQLS
jgi:hypothetical protein